MTFQTEALRRFDVVIVGGGPAGSSAGLTLLKRQGMSVALIEKSDYSSPRIGESLSPGTRPLLEYLQVWERFRQEQSLQSYGSQAAWGSAELRALDYMFTLHGNGWALERVRFDRMLGDIFRERGGTLLSSTRFAGCEAAADGGWTVKIGNAANEIETLACRFLIDASGRAGIIAKHLDAPRMVYDRLVGVGSIGRLPDSRAVESVTQVEACEYGWWYSSPVPGNRVSVVLMSDADIIKRLQAVQPECWRTLLQAMPLTSARTDAVAFEQEPRAFACHSSYLQQVGGRNWVAVGDALASHDPLSSSGIPHAIGSGVHGALTAADALFAEGKLLESFQQSIHQDFSQYLQTHWQYYQREARWADSLFWQRRRTAIAISADAAIEAVAWMHDEPENGAIHLSAQQARELYSLCRPGRLLHEVAADFSHIHPQVPDEKIILGLQELVAFGCLGLQGGEWG